MKTKGKQKLPAGERRRTILDAAIPLFVEQGFRGVTTRVIAEKAGISEALLYQHFPSKEALYAEVQDQLSAVPSHVNTAMGQLTPSTETLVWLLYMAARSMIDPPPILKSNPLFPRLMLQSLLEDGEFARLHTERRLGELRDIVTQSYACGREQGEILDGEQDSTPDHLQFWFAHHVMAMVHLLSLPDVPILHYSDQKQKIIDYVMLFVLRGMGLKSIAIRKYYHIEQLRSRFDRLFQLSPLGGTP